MYKKGFFPWGYWTLWYVKTNVNDKWLISAVAVKDFVGLNII